MSAEMSDKYNQPNIQKSLLEETELWQRDFAFLSKEELCAKAVQFTHNNVRDMNWADDDIDGVVWFLGFYTRVILDTRFISDSFADIMTLCMREYFNLPIS